MNDKPRRGHNSIRFEIVTSYEQLLHAQAVRSICFVEEEGVAAKVIFDGNDWQATHIIAYDGEEPIGTLRIRWFKDFAQFERTAFRQAWRNSHVLRACADFAFHHVQLKGYTRVITHAAPLYARLWRMLLGFQPAPGKEPLTIEGHEHPYIELIKVLPLLDGAITEQTNANVLFQVEGSWTLPDARDRTVDSDLLPPAVTAAGAAG
ncbi:MAG TPA: hypothetical protein VHD15_08235 [Hyphomicrobiales bacterium]|nr:hypothetical protein [Hyphomicrobiales bacterium]